METPRKKINKIVIIGPESTGKSSLSHALANHFNGLAVEEYAREYLLTNGTDYTYENLLDVAKGQLALEDKAIQEIILNQSIRPFAFIDTDMYVMKVWCEFVFQQCHPFILDQIVERKYDLYLLCNVDVPWVKDELREYPDLATRQTLYHHYRDIMLNQQVPWIDISGDYNTRLQTAIAGVEKYCSL
jgi:NadR type nicotinamide-nucleotide adenylyltransferase